MYPFKVWASIKTLMIAKSTTKFDLTKEKKRKKQILKSHAPSFI